MEITKDKSYIFERVYSCLLKTCSDRKRIINLVSYFKNTPHNTCNVPTHISNFCCFDKILQLDILYF